MRVTGQHIVDERLLPLSAIRAVNVFLCVIKWVKGLTPALLIRSQCRVIAESNLGTITLTSFISIFCCACADETFQKIQQDPVHIRLH